MSNYQDFEDFQSNERTNFKEIIYKYLRFWPLYLAGILIALIIAKIQLRYEPLIYTTTTTIKILDESSESEIDLSGLPQGSKLFGNSINLANEIEILRSKRLLMKVINDLKMETFYYSQGKVVTSELWKDNYPFIVNWINSDSSKTIEASPMFNVEFIDKDRFNIKYGENVEFKDVKFNQPVITKHHTFSIQRIKGEDYKRKAEKEVKLSFKYKPAIERAADLAKNLVISQVSSNSDLLSLSIRGPFANKNEAILDNIVYQFNEDGIEDKKRLATRTEEFVTNRLYYLVHELDTIESSLVNYKQRNTMVSIEDDAQKYSMRNEETTTATYSITTKIEIMEYLMEEFEKGDTYTLVPLNLGIDNSTINALSTNLNSLVLEREKNLISSTRENPIVKKLSNEIITLRESLISNIQSHYQKLIIEKDIIDGHNENSKQTLTTIPKKEKEIRNIKRQQEIKEALYLFLLQKRESASLSAAVTSPSVKVVDFAYTTPKPISPNRKSHFLVAIFVGLIIPLGFVYLRILLNSKIQNRDQVTKSLGSHPIPIVGEIPLLSKDVPHLVGVNDRSELAEAFRVVRTNLNFIKNKNPEDELGQVILVTSSTKSEGKTFTSINTALTLASSNHKVLLVGADLRNPQLHQYVGIDKSSAGLTSYLYDETVEIDSLIQQGILDFSSLDLIISGFIPPNPAELLLNGRFEQFISHVKKSYDYIVIDCAPTLLVTDTLLLAKHADISIYMIRAAFTDLKLVDYISGLNQSKKLNRISLVINGISSSASYGYKYNYGYGYNYESSETKLPWYKNIIRKVKELF